MGLISKRMTLYGARGKRSVEALFDSGSIKSFVRGSVARSLGALAELAEPKKFEMAKGSFTVRDAFIGDVKIGRHRVIGTFLVVEDLTEELIIGADFLQEWHIRLEPRRRRILLDPQALRLKAVSAGIIL